MKISSATFPQDKITVAKLPAFGDKPERTGFKIGGAWLNGSENHLTKESLLTWLDGKELCASKSGKSLVVVGEFQPIDVSFLKDVIVAREVMEYTDLSDLL